MLNFTRILLCFTLLLALVSAFLPKQQRSHLSFSSALQAKAKEPAAKAKVPVPAVKAAAPKVTKKAVDVKPEKEVGFKLIATKNANQNSHFFKIFRVDFRQGETRRHFERKVGSHEGRL